MNPSNTGAVKAAADDVVDSVSSGIDSAKDTLTQRRKPVTNGTNAPAATTATEADDEKKSGDWAGASREKGSSPLGTVLFVSLRLADVVFQYSLVRYGLMPFVMSYLPIGGHVITHRLDADSHASMFGLGLTHYHTTLVLFSFIAALKQIIWILFISEQKMPPTFALIVAGFNTFLNTLNTFFSLWSRSSGAVSQEYSLYLVEKSVQYAIPIGWGLFSAGIFIELASEIQRKIFKNKPENKGMPMKGGLWDLATNINYGGYTLWRAGYACFAGRLGWGGLVGMFIGTDFVRRAIPSMDKYCTERYGKEWEAIRDKTGYNLLPGII